MVYTKSLAIYLIAIKCFNFSDEKMLNSNFTTIYTILTTQNRKL